MRDETGEITMMQALGIAQRYVIVPCQGAVFWRATNRAFGMSGINTAGVDAPDQCAPTPGDALRNDFNIQQIAGTVLKYRDQYRSEPTKEPREGAF